MGMEAEARKTARKEADGALERLELALRDMQRRLSITRPNAGAMCGMLGAAARCARTGNMDEAMFFAASMDPVVAEMLAGAYCAVRKEP